MVQLLKVTLCIGLEPTLKPLLQLQSAPEISDIIVSMRAEVESDGKYQPFTRQGGQDSLEKWISLYLVHRGTGLGKASHQS